MTVKPEALLNIEWIEAERRRRRSAFLTLFADQGPLRRELYLKHLEFFAAGSRFKECLFMAANRVVSGRELMQTEPRPEPIYTSRNYGSYGWMA